jgi:hypothetical protein
MKTLYRPLLFSSAFVIALLVSLVRPLNVRADDATPPPPDAPAAAAQPSAPSNQTSESPGATQPSNPTDQPNTPADASQAPALADQPTDAPGATQSPPPADQPTGVRVVTQDPSPTDQPTDAPSVTQPPSPTDVAAGSSDATPAPTDTSTPPSTLEAQSTSIPAVLDQAPAGTQVVVLDQAGQPQPLATQQALNILATGDPIWCPSGVSPSAGSGGCTGSYSDLASLVGYLSGSQPAQNGTIWITSGADNSGTDILIDGTTLTTWKDYALTLQGGWNGSSTGAISGVSNFDKSISITSWNNTVAVDNINISNTSGTGLTVQTSRDIQLSNVSSSGSSGDGARLDNSSGTGNVNLNGTNTFSSNQGSYGGLYVKSNGSISLSNVTASGNVNGLGAYLFNASASLPQNVTLSGTNVMSSNGSYGLEIDTLGAITLNNLTTNNNGNYGTILFNNNGSGGEDVTLNGAGQFNGNTGTGIEINSWGNISTSNLTANQNGGYGASMYNSLASTAKNVILSGTNTFNGNFANGLYVSSNGDINADTIIASQNLNSDGAILFNNLGTGNISLGSSSSSIFNGNNGNGLRLVSTGDIILVQVTADNNTAGSGLTLTTSGQAQVSCGDFSGNSNYGLDATLSGGDLTLNSVGSSGNTNGNVHLTNVGTVAINPAYPCPAPKPQKLQNGSSQSTNGEGASLPTDIIPVTGAGPVVLDCSRFGRIVLQLADGDQIVFVCPVGGKATLDEVFATGLPGTLPDGDAFASGLATSLTGSDGPPGGVITSGGDLIVSFGIPSEKKGAQFSILYWDPTLKDGAGDWVELPAFDTDAHGDPVVTPLHPDHPQDQMQVLTGIRITSDGRVEATVNFPGTFVLIVK